MSRHVPDLKARRKAGVTTQDSGEMNVVEPAIPPKHHDDGEKKSKKISTGRQLPVIPHEQLQAHAKPYSQTSSAAQGEASAASGTPPGQRRRKTASTSPAWKSSVSAQLQGLRRSMSGPEAEMSAETRKKDVHGFDERIAEELETSGGFVSPESRRESSFQDNMHESGDLTAARRRQMHMSRRTSLPVAPMAGLSVVQPSNVRRPSHGSVLPKYSGTRFRRSSVGGGGRKTSTRKTSTIYSANLQEQWMLRVDIHLQALSLFQTKSYGMRQKSIDFSRNSLNISASLGSRVDSCSPFDLEKGQPKESIGTPPSEVEFTSTLQQVLSLPVCVGVPLDNPEKFLSKDIRVTAEYGRRDVGSGLGLSTINWHNLASGNLDITTELSAGTKHFKRQFTVPLVMHQMYASKTHSCTLDCTVIGSVVQKKTEQEIDATEEFNFDEDVFEYLGTPDDDEDDMDDDMLDQENSPSGAVPDGRSKHRASVPASAAASQRVSTGTAMRLHKRSTPVKRPSRVSATDAPSEVGQDPMRTTAAFAFEDSFNRLGLLHVSVSNAKYQIKKTATGMGSEKRLQDGDMLHMMAEINGGLTKQKSPSTMHSAGMLMKWDPKQPHFTFYTLKSRQIFLSLYRESGSAASSSKSRNELMGLGSIPLSDISDLSDKIPFSYAQPSTASFLRDDRNLQHSIKLTPYGEAAVYVSFRSLCERQPFSGRLRVRCVGASALKLPQDISRLSCALKVDGVFKGMSSESEVDKCEASWNGDRFCEISCKDGVDLEVHVWTRTSSGQSWLACGVLPLAVIARRQADQQAEQAAQAATSPADDPFQLAVKQELWIPLEPKGFVHVEVLVADGGILQSRESREHVSPIRESLPVADQNKEDAGSPEMLQETKEPTGDPRQESSLSSADNKKVPTWEEMLQLMKDRVELRAQVDFLHETLRATKAQLAESEFSKAKLELENRQLHEVLRSTKQQTKTIAKKATLMELRELVSQAEQEEELGYSTA